MAENENSNNALDQFNKLSDDEKRYVIEVGRAAKTLEDPYQKALFVGRSALEGHTLGLSEPVISTLKASVKSFSPQVDFAGAYKEDVEQRRAEKAAAPGTDIAAQVGGAFIPSPINIGTKIGGVAMKGGEVLSKAYNVANAYMRGAIKGGLAGLASTGAMEAIEVPTGFKKPEGSLERIAAGTIIGGAFGAPLEKVGEVGSEIAKKGLLKEGAKETVEAGKRLGIEPTPGQLYKSQFIQELESSMRNEPLPNAAKAAMQSRNEKLNDVAESMFEEAIGLSKAEVGASVRERLIQKVNDMIAPAKEIYEELYKKYGTATAPILKTNNVIVDLQDAAQLDVNSKTIENVLNQFKPALERIQTISDLKRVRESIGAFMRNTDDDVAKGVAGKIYEALTQDRAQGLRDAGAKVGDMQAGKAVELADSIYKGAAQTVGEALPVKVPTTKPFQAVTKQIEQTERLKVGDKFFNLNNLDQLKKFQEQFPTEFDALRRARLSELQDKSGGTAAGFIRMVKQLEPEHLFILFGKNGSQKAKDITTFIESIPERVGGSDTPRGTNWANFVKNMVSLVGPLETYSKDQLYRLLTGMISGEKFSSALQRRVALPVSIGFKPAEENPMNRRKK